MRLLPALALSAALALGACRNPDGSTDWGGTLALTGGLAALTGVALLAAQDGREDGRHRRQYRRHGGFGHPGYRAPRYRPGAPYAHAHYPRGW